MRQRKALLLVRWFAWVDIRQTLFKKMKPGREKPAKRQTEKHGQTNERKDVYCTYLGEHADRLTNIYIPIDGRLDSRTDNQSDKHTVEKIDNQS